MDVLSVRRILSTYRYSFEDELELQNGIAAALAANDIPFEREYRLDKKDRPDFYCPGSGIVIEVKIQFSRTQVLRQLHRYTSHSEVRSVLLVTSRSCHGLPEYLNGKNIVVLNVGRI